MNYKLLSQYLLVFFMKTKNFKLINNFIKTNNINKYNMYQFSSKILDLLDDWSSAESIVIKRMLKQLIRGGS